MEIYSPKIRSTQLFVQELPNELVVYDVERNEVHCLNGSAARVWTLCDGNNTVAEIARQLGSDLEPEAVETLVWMALDQFAEKHLLEEARPAVPHRPADMTRRQMVLRVGLAVALLPMVDSIIAPPAALAQSAAPGCTPGLDMTGMGPGGCTTT
jgi:hypothetical protein